MSNQMRKLIDLVEEAQINQYLDRLQNAKTQEEFESIINEAKLIEAPGMMDKIKKRAMGLGLAGAMAMGGQAMADEPVSSDPGADVNKSQAVQSAHAVHPSYGQLDTNPTYYPTTQHYKVAEQIIIMSFRNLDSEIKKLEELVQKDKQWWDDSGKINLNIGPSPSPFARQVSKQLELVNQAKYDLMATRYSLKNPRFIERYADNPDKAKGKIEPGAGNKAGVAAIKLYLQKVKSFEAPDSAGRNVPQ